MSSSGAKRGSHLRTAADFVACTPGTRGTELARKRSLGLAETGSNYTGRV